MNDRASSIRWWRVPPGTFERVALAGIAFTLVLRGLNASNSFSGVLSGTIYLLASILALAITVAALNAKSVRWQVVGVAALLMVLVVQDRLVNLFT